MEQLNRKRNDLVGQQTVLNGKIATREEKESYLKKRKAELEARSKELLCKFSNIYLLLLQLSNSISVSINAEKIQKLHTIKEEFDKFIETTENSQAKIDESVATLLYVVKKESDTIIRKKSAIGA